MKFVQNSKFCKKKAQTIHLNFLNNAQKPFSVFNLLFITINL